MGPRKQTSPGIDPSTATVNGARPGLAFVAGNALRVARVGIERNAGRPPTYLPILLLFLTNKCNLRCAMCGVWQHNTARETAGELSTGEWTSVLDSASHLGTSLISISGGEPLLRPDLNTIIAHARELGIAVHLCSNGTTLTDARIARLRGSGVNTLSVSLESHLPEIHDGLRGSGTFHKVVRGIELLRDKAPEIRVGLNYLITALNFRDMDRMISLAKDLGVHQVKFAPIHTNLQHKGKRTTEFEPLVFKDHHLAALERELDKLHKAMEGSELLSVSPMFLSGISTYYRHAGRFRCYAGYVACAINPFGSVTPCCDLDGGLSVRDRPLEEIWRSEAFDRLRSRVRRCDSACWDTTNTELSLRMNPLSMLRDAARTIKELSFYFGDRRP